MFIQETFSVAGRSPLGAKENCAKTCNNQDSGNFKENFS